jgi:hypothetical protein
VSTTDSTTVSTTESTTVSTTESTTVSTTEISTVSTTGITTVPTTYPSRMYIHRTKYWIRSLARKRNKRFQLLLCCVSWAVKSFDDLCKPLSVIDLKNQWNKLCVFRVNICIDILFMYYTKRICSSWDTEKPYIYC